MRSTKITCVLARTSRNAVRRRYEDANSAGFFAEFSPVDQFALQAGATFEMGVEIEIVLGRPLGNLERADKRGDGGDRFLSRLEIFKDVGPEVELAVGLKDALDVAQHAVVHDAAFFVAFLPPGIGEVDMHSHGTRVGKKIGEQSLGIAVHHAGVCQVAVGEAGSTEAGVLGGDFGA